MRRQIFALVDACNFYVSVERVFNASLHHKAVVVLSNGDGNIVAASAEAKALGLKRGTPYFQCRHLILRYNVAVFSSNYTLYQSMSDRMMDILAGFAAVRNGTQQQEIYSIDECFLDLSHIPTSQLLDYGRAMQEYIMRATGIPVRIGIASTKVMTKIAAEMAKRDASHHDVVNLVEVSEHEIDAILATIAIDEIWHLGKKRASKLESEYVFSAESLKYMPPSRIRKILGVVGERIVYELRGISCLTLEIEPKPRKAILVSRSLSCPIEKFEDLAEAISYYAAKSAEKLRRQNSMAASISIFVSTNHFDLTVSQYSNGASKQLPLPTDFTPDIIFAAKELLKNIYQSNVQYKRAGVSLTGLQPNTIFQPPLFFDYSVEKEAKKARLMAIVDIVNTFCEDRDLLHFAAQGIRRNWQVQFRYRSPRYSTRWSELIEVF